MCMCVVLCVTVALLVASVCAVAPFEASDKHLLPFGCLGAHGYFLSGRSCSNLTRCPDRPAISRPLPPALPVLILRILIIFDIT